MGIVLTNTLSGRKEPLTPRIPGEVRLYWCGVTVYSRSHVGHARSFITPDILCRYLRARGLKTVFVRNFTDIDDKIIARAAAEGIETSALTAREIAAFERDIAWLGCLPPAHQPRATAHVDDMVAMIGTLVDMGFAYPVADGSVYFRVGRVADYGKLSHQRVEDMACAEAPDPTKEDAHDFALWKGAKPGEPTWPSPWGPGRPGWHIECSAMAARYLDQPFDVHGGGTDLIFPHHENELAQSEAVAGVPFANLWVHNGMITTGSEKMSKSLGNIRAIEDLAAEVPADAVRLLFLGTHYRSPLDFGPGRLEESLRALDRLYESLGRADEAGATVPAVPLDGALTGELSEYEQTFCTAMDDDMNAAKALGHVFDRFRDLNRALDAGDVAGATTIRGEIDRTGGLVLGLFQQPASDYLAGRRAAGQARSGLSASEIEAAIAARIDARKRKDFKEADAIRARLAEQGIVLEDGPQGTTWKTA